MSVQTTSQEGLRVTLPAIQATDAVGSATVTTTPASGSLFPVGTTQVSVVAQDPAGNQATCTFAVTVSAATNPGGGDGGEGEDEGGGGCGCAATSAPGAGAAWTALLMLGAFLQLRRQRGT